MKNTKDKTSDSRKKCKHIDDSERQMHVVKSNATPKALPKKPPKEPKLP